MRLVIQRVTSASVSTAERGVIGAIDKGLCVLVGIGHGDGDKEVEWAIKNLLNVKFWPNEETGAPWKVDVCAGGHKVLLVSQFTLYGKVYKKGRLDFHNAAPPADARMLYAKLVEGTAGALGADRTQSGEFGATMEVSSGCGLNAE
jgi:D-tyrosyl-tRNA(Tyr) deacylase